jgi:hypothetical protein
VTIFAKKLAPWLLVVILGLGLAACGGDDDNKPTTTGAATGSTGTANTGSNAGGDPGDWEGEFETGTDVTLTLWVDPADPALADFEAFRQAAGANPVLYGRVTATNDGAVQDTSRFVTLTGKDGEMFDGSATEVEFLCSHVARWIAAVATLNTELNEQYTKLYTEDCGAIMSAGPVIAPGETVTYFVAYPGDTEPEFERVFMGLGNELKR